MPNRGVAAEIFDSVSVDSLRCWRSVAKYLNSPGRGEPQTPAAQLIKAYSDTQWSALMGNPVVGNSTGGGPAVSGEGTNGSGGVLATSDSGNGVSAITTSGIAVWGLSKTNVGLKGQSESGGGMFGSSAGGDGVHGETTSQTNYGISGLNNSAWPCVAIYGSSDNGHGVKGLNGNGSGKSPKSGCGVWGDSQNGYGVYGASQDGTAGFFDGNVSVTGTINVSGDVVLAAVIAGGGDCAERFDLKELETADPGSVMVIDDSGALRLCNTAYDRKVAGVVSGAGTLRPGIVLDQGGGDEGRTTIALVGKVFCKVNADYGPIAVGDLLTSSETPGHAMRVSDPLKGFGAVIGKAMRPMQSGQGLLPILVALQ